MIQLAIELLSEAKSSPEQIAYENATQAARRRRIGSVVGTGDEVEWATITCGNFENPTRDQLLQQMMAKLVENCERLSSNEFANYVIQVSPPSYLNLKKCTQYEEIVTFNCSML